jgi:hypothetical protein
MPTSTELANALVSPAGSGDSNDAALVAPRLAAVFPEDILKHLQQNRTKVRVCRNSITDHLTSLRGQTPRGWPPGSTWDQVPGIFNPGTNEVVIAIIGHPDRPHIPQLGEGKGSVDLVVHETAHGLDMGGGSPFLSAGTAFITARNQDLRSLTAYELQPGSAGEQETFAESAARFFDSDDDSMPALHAFWATISGLLTGPSSSPGTFHFPFFSSQIGSAMLGPDGETIQMRLRATADDGPIGDAMIEVSASHPANQQIREHIKELNASEPVAVAAFED